MLFHDELAEEKSFIESGVSSDSVNIGFVEFVRLVSGHGICDVEALINYKYSGFKSENQ